MFPKENTSHVWSNALKFVLIYYFMLICAVSLRFAPSVMSFWILSSKWNTNAEDLNVKETFHIYWKRFVPNKSLILFLSAFHRIWFICDATHWLRWRRESKIKTHKIRHEGRERASKHCELVKRFSDALFAFKTMKKKQRPNKSIHRIRATNDERNITIPHAKAQNKRCTASDASKYGAWFCS